MKRLIINADDLGLTPAINRGILEAHRQGIVTSTTLMANGAAFEDAVSLACSAPGLAIGCHVDLIQLAPTLPPQKVPTLCEDGHFRHGLSKLALRSFLGAIDPQQSASEIAAQVRKLHSAGIRVSHLDTHKHAHVFPAVLAPLLRAARECGVRAIRNPFEPRAIVPLGQVLSRPDIAKRWAAVRLLATMGVRFRHHVNSAGMVTTDGTLGIVFTGHLDQPALCKLLRRVPEGSWELVVHPGFNDPPLAGLSRLTIQREAELRLLTSSEIRQAIESAGIELITYADLAT